MKTLPGRDFQELEDGRLVFTREYLLSRGTCCDSHCLNCPFQHKRYLPSHSTKCDVSVISMVPSWTETLLHAGIAVVGRTRFCIHPIDLVEKIKVYGGTKSLSPVAREDLNRAFGDVSVRKKTIVVLDKEENPKEFADFFLNEGFSVHVTHVSSLDTMENEFVRFSDLFRETHPQASIYFKELSRRTKLAVKAKNRTQTDGLKFNFSEALLGRTVSEAELKTKTKLAYLIWKSPWMCVGRLTFIESMLNQIVQTSGPADILWTPIGEADKYPQIEIDQIPKTTLLVYSSEPYPFERELKSLPPGVLVDGERLSWFGIRALRYLETIELADSV